MSSLATILAPEAERLAREAYEAHSAAVAAHTSPSVTAYPWEYLNENARRVYIAAHLALLTDLNRPASMDHLKRFVAGRVGLNASNLTWTYRPAFGRDSVACWRLVDGHGRVWALCDYPPDIEAVLGPPETRDGYTSVRNLPTDPAQALTLAALALTPNPSGATSP